MNTIFMNSRNSKTSNPHKLFFNLTDQMDLKKRNRYIALSNLSIYYTRQNIKKSDKSNKLKYKKVR